MDGSVHVAEIVQEAEHVIPLPTSPDLHSAPRLLSTVGVVGAGASIYAVSDIFTEETTGVWV